MSDVDDQVEPDWDSQINLALTPGAIAHALFWSADTVHTGWDSCIEHDLIMWEITALDDNNDNYCRLVEQEYADDENAEMTWHDWTVELKLGSIHVTGHWRAQANSNFSDWDWCAAEAEKAYTSACLLVGKRVRRGLVVESQSEAPRVSRTHH
ncbi:MAG: hypothetical protein AB7Q97_05085 [Gammaproteobacteria bacterium]